MILSSDCRYVKNDFANGSFDKTRRKSPGPPSNIKQGYEPRGKQRGFEPIPIRFATGIHSTTTFTSDLVLVKVRSN